MSSSTKVCNQLEFEPSTPSSCTLGAHMVRFVYIRQKLKGNVTICCCPDKLATMRVSSTAYFGTTCYDNRLSVQPGIDFEMSGTHQWRPNFNNMNQVSNSFDKSIIYNKIK